MMATHRHCCCSAAASSSKEHEFAAAHSTTTARIAISASDESTLLEFTSVRHYLSFSDDSSSGRIIARKRPRRVGRFGCTNQPGIFLVIAMLGILGTGAAAIPPVWNADYDDGPVVSDNNKNYSPSITTATTKTATAETAEQQQQPEKRQRKWSEPKQRTLRFLAEGEPCRPEWHPHNRNNAASKSNQAMVEEGEEPGEICAPGLKCARMTSTDGEEGDGEAGSETYRCVGGAKVAKKRKWQRFYRVWREKCTAVMSGVADCHAVRQLPPPTICPSDSRLVLPARPTLADCCKFSGTRDDENTTMAALRQRFCQCDFAECERQGAVTRPCPYGTRRYLVSAGGGTANRPGSCCDQFECRPSEPHCANVECLDSSQTYDIYASGGEMSLSADSGGGVESGGGSVETSESSALSCPADSFRPVVYVPKGACCPIIPSCRCRAGICPPARCSEPKARLVITRRGENRPGLCCDEFKCVAEDASTDAEVSSADRSATHCRDVRNEGGRVYADGERWHVDSCETCACHGGVALCRRMQCPMVPPDCGWVGVPDGECCPICLGCRDDAGQRRVAGDIWSRDDCTNCTCGDDFRWHCQKSICKTECDNPRHVPGQCCPICDEPLVVELPVVCASVAMCSLRCEHGLLRNKWGCFECECAAAVSLATDEHPSAAVNAEEFTGAAAVEVIPERQDTSGSVTSELGGSVAETDELRTNVRACEPLTPSNCNKQCAHGFRRSSRTNCPICRCASCPLLATQRCYKHCLYGYATNSHGCRLCKCRPHDAATYDNAISNEQRSRGAGDDDESNKTTVIHRVENVDTQRQPSESVKPPPAYGHHRTHHTHYSVGRESDDGCYVTSVSGMQLIRRDSGEWWTDDHCRQCFCQHRTIFCSIVMCATRPAAGCPNGAEWFRQKGECCPSCVARTELSSADSPAPVVPTTTAAAPTWRAVCYGPGDGLFVDGETWRVGGGGGRDNGCVACTCRMGHVLCAATECAPLACTHPVPDPSNECCLKCPLEESVENNGLEIRRRAESVGMALFCMDDVTGLSHAVGTAWRVDECRACRCDTDGRKHCFTQTCDNAAVMQNCMGRQLLIKGRCCPICSYVLNGNNRRHYDGGVSQQLDMVAVTPPLLADRLATFPQNVVLLTALGVFASIVLLLCAFLLFIGWRCVRNASAEKFATLDDGELAAVSRAIGGKLSIGSAMAVAAPFSALRHCSSGSAVPQNFLIVGDTPPATPSRKSRSVVTAPSAGGLPLRANSSLYAPKRRTRGQPRVSIGAHSVAEDSSTHYDDGDEEAHVLAVPEIHTGQADAEQRRRLLPSSVDASSGGGSGCSNRLSTASSSPSTRDRFHPHHPAAMVAAASTTMLGGSTTTMTTTVSGSANGTVENLSTLGPADFTARSASNAADAMRPGATSTGESRDNAAESSPGGLSAPVPMRGRTTTSAAAL